MSMFQTHAPAPGGFSDGQASSFDLSRLLRTAKARLLHFAVPYLLVLLAGSAVIAWLKPIYRSEGTILVQSPEIPADLVRPTITEVADQRVQVIQQRIMARDNLMAVISKYNLFPGVRDAASSSELIELVRARTIIKPVEMNTSSDARAGSPTIAFTLSFDYEDPTTAMNVANEFLTAILREDANARNRDAASTTAFLQQDVKRIEAEHNAVISQLSDLQKQLSKSQAEKRANTNAQDWSALNQKKKSLADVEIDLAQKSSIYGADHPVIVELKRIIASMKKEIASLPAPPSAPPAAEPVDADGNGPNALNATASGLGANVDAYDLLRRETELRKTLEEANSKLTTARLGETMERNQQGERLQVIEQPSLPHKPVSPKKYKWIGGVLALSAMAGIAVVVVAEMLDGSLRGAGDLAGLVDRGMLVVLPYLASPREKRWERRRLVFTCLVVALISVAALGAAALRGSAISATLLGMT